MLFQKIDSPEQLHELGPTSIIRNADTGAPYWRDGQFWVHPGCELFHSDADMAAVVEHRTNGVPNGQFAALPAYAVWCA